MAALVRLGRQAFCRINSLARPFSATSQSCSKGSEDLEPVTHTGQQYAVDDYRRIRFIDKEKLVNTNFAVKLIEEDPVVVVNARTVWSDSGGSLGHPKVYINLDPPGTHTCGYSGRKFVQKKHYDQATMGPSITYEEYLEQVRPKNRD